MQSCVKFYIKFTFYVVNTERHLSLYLVRTGFLCKKQNSTLGKNNSKEVHDALFILLILKVRYLLNLYEALNVVFVDMILVKLLFNT